VSAFDFRSLQPLLFQDVNGNLNEVVLDDLGRVAASAALGKGDEGDSLDSLKAELLDQGQQALLTAQFLAQADLASATALLGGATVRWVYDDGQLPARPASSASATPRTWRRPAIRCGCSWRSSIRAGKGTW
jgi:hypothetical protein